MIASHDDWALCWSLRRPECSPPVWTPVEPYRGVNTALEKDPEDWVTGDEPMTGARASYLKTLCEEAHEPFEPNLTKAAASKRIGELKAKMAAASVKGRAYAFLRRDFAAGLAKDARR